MQLGVELPTSGPLAGTASIGRVAVEAERIGYTTVWAYERLLRPMAKLPEAGDPPQRISEFYRLTFEPLQTLSYVAGLTSSIGLDVRHHRPAARAGRAGAPIRDARPAQWRPGHRRAGSGMDPAGVRDGQRLDEPQGAAIDEMAAAMRACWGPDPVEYHGDL